MNRTQFDDVEIKLIVEYVGRGDFMHCALISKEWHGKYKEVHQDTSTFTSRMVSSQSRRCLAAAHGHYGLSLEAYWKLVGAHIDGRDFQESGESVKNLAAAEGAQLPRSDLELWFCAGAVRSNALQVVMHFMAVYIRDDGNDRAPLNMLREAVRDNAVRRGSKDYSLQIWGSTLWSRTIVEHQVHHTLATVALQCGDLIELDYILATYGIFALPLDVMIFWSLSVGEQHAESVMWLLEMLGFWYLDFKIDEELIATDWLSPSPVFVRCFTNVRRNRGYGLRCVDSHTVARLIERAIALGSLETLQAMQAEGWGDWSEATVLRLLQSLSPTTRDSATGQWLSQLH